jgi:hypothetical protein
MADDEQPRIVATFDSYVGMLEAIRARVNELQISGENLDAYAGLPRAYTQKIIGPKPVRRLGMTSFGPVLNALGLRCLFIEDDAATQRLKNRMPPRKSQYVRPGMRAGSVQILLTDKFMRKIRKKGGQNSRKYLGKRLVKQLARKAANARWQKTT